MIECGDLLIRSPSPLMDDILPVSCNEIDFPVNIIVDGHGEIINVGVAFKFQYLDITGKEKVHINIVVIGHIELSTLESRPLRFT
ncbi:hypothetical protein K7X08_011352 [Anisodus acutangulus]|uniref:Uncharacterized protein n=1 Tax=Anisodus acutangulus TaxID=402998 RepID=A0A9Q1M1Z3_9SOLA|nr:hypothetical protein K7X08_011352 [Anisodus acutangulus]